MLGEVKMAEITAVLEEYLSEDPIRWGKLASNVQWRRLQLLTLREILLELRKLNQGIEQLKGKGLGG